MPGLFTEYKVTIKVLMRREWTILSSERANLFARIRSLHTIDVLEDFQRTSMQKRMNIPMSQTKSYLTLPDAPALAGLAFRFFQGEADFPINHEITWVFLAFGEDGSNEQVKDQYSNLLKLKTKRGYFRFLDTSLLA